jgi:hypothetical protein
MGSNTHLGSRPSGFAMIQNPPTRVGRHVRHVAVDGQTRAIRPKRFPIATQLSKETILKTILK